MNIYTARAYMRFKAETYAEQVLRGWLEASNVEHFISNDANDSGDHPEVSEYLHQFGMQCFEEFSGSPRGDV